MPEPGDDGGGGDKRPSLPSENVVDSAERDRQLAELIASMEELLLATMELKEQCLEAQKNALQAGPAQKNGSSGDDPVCLICLDAGPDELGEPLVRDCSCRGTSGHAHISCIDRWARQKAESWGGDGRNKIYDLFRPWLRCCQCKQIYQRQVALDLVDKLLKFVEENYRDVPSIYLRALRYQVSALGDVGMREEAKRKADIILSNVGRLKEEMGALPNEVLDVAFHTYNSLGHSMLRPRSETTVESERMAACARMAVEYFEKALDSARAAVGDQRIAIASAEAAVADAKFRCERNIEWAQTAAEKYRIVYNARVASRGPGHQDTISAGIDLAYGLRDAHRTLEAQRLAANVVAISKQYHGPCNRVTEVAELLLRNCTKRYVTVIPRKNIRRYTPEQQAKWGYDEDDLCVLGHDDDGRKVSVRCGLLRRLVLGFEEDGAKCIIGGGSCSSSSGNGWECSTITLDSENVRPALGTPVVCHGLEQSHLNGKIGEVRSMDEESGLPIVHFEDPDIEPQPVDDGCMRILCDLPVESDE